MYWNETKECMEREELKTTTRKVETTSFKTLPRCTFL